LSFQALVTTTSCRPSSSTSIVKIGRTITGARIVDVIDMGDPQPPEPHSIRIFGCTTQYS
jgi:hypothetical protein